MHPVGHPRSLDGTARGLTCAGRFAFAVAFWMVSGLTAVAANGGAVGSESSAAGARFLQALREGRIEEVRTNLARVPSLASARFDGCPALVLAVQSRRPDVVELLLERGADVHACDTNGNAALHYCLPDRGAGPLARLLLARGANPNATNLLGETPLHRLAEEQQFHDGDEGPDPGGFPDEVQAALAMLVGQGARVDARDREGMTPLHRVVERSSVHAARLLLALGADPRARALDGRTPLHLAVVSAGWAPEGGDWKGHPNHAALLVGRGAEVNARAEDGRTPLHVLLTSGGAFRASWLKLLLSLGADPNLADAEGRTPLHLAASGRWPWADLEPLVGVLVESGANMRAVDKRGRTLLHCLAQLSDAPPYLSRIPAPLLKNPEILDWLDADGNTALHLAARGGNSEMVDSLVRGGANVRLRNRANQTAVALMPTPSPSLVGAAHELFASIVRGDLDSVKAYLSADPAMANHRNQYTRGTALEYAAWQNQPEITELLLRHGAEVTAAAAVMLNRPADLARQLPVGQRLETAGGFAGTLLHLAASRGFADCLRLLLARQPDLDVVDSEGHTAWFEARLRGHAEAAELLRSHGAQPSLFDAAALGLTNRLTQLLSAGAACEERHGLSSLTAMHEAAARNQPAAAAQLLAAGLAVDVAAPDGTRPVHSAAQSNAVDSIRWLVAHGAGVDAVDALGRTPLQHAAMLGNLASVQLLVGLGADVDAQSPGRPGFLRGPGFRVAARNTALHWAAAAGHPGVVEWLLAHGARPGALNGYGATARQLALTAPLQAEQAQAMLLVDHAARMASPPGGYMVVQWPGPTNEVACRRVLELLPGAPAAGER